MKKNILSIIAIVCAVAALAVSLYAIISVNSLKADWEKQLSALEASIEAARQPAEPAPGEISGLMGWSLSPAPWAENDGANIRLTATPDSYSEALTAALIAELDGSIVAESVCQWDEGNYTATVSLPAANGYSYRFVLSEDPDGQNVVLDVTLASKENLADPLCVYLEDSLAAYCNLIIADWSGNEELTVSAYGQVQLPQISFDGGNLTLSGADLVLTLNEAELSRQAVSFDPGEASESFEADITGISFAVPEMGAEDILELWLEATLSDGSKLTVCGAGWYCEDGELFLISG